MLNGTFHHHSELLRHLGHIFHPRGHLLLLVKLFFQLLAQFLVVTAAGIKSNTEFRLIHERHQQMLGLQELMTILVA